MKNTFFNELLAKGGTEIITSEINEVIPQIITIPNNKVLGKYICGGLCVIGTVSCLIQSIDCIVKKDFKGFITVILAHLAILVGAMGMFNMPPIVPLGWGIKSNW